MNVHEQFADDIALYALGALSAEERLALDQHLQECSACNQQLEQVRGDLALLAISASGPRPPARSGQRLMAAIAKEPRRAQFRSRERKIRWGALEWGFAAACAVVVLGLALRNLNLHRRVSELEVNFSAQQEQMVQAKQLIAALTSADAAHFTLVASKSPPQPQGKAIYQRNTGTLVFLASNMPELPPQKTYELWLIPARGTPVPAGLFRPDTHGSAAVIKPPLPTGIEAKTFAITVEPESGSAAPTSMPIMVGIGG
jgi:anti-sigma-K factor RskA